MSNLTTIVGFLKGKGLSGEAIAGIVGNLMVESQLSPNATNSGEGAIGIAQWEGGRRTALENFANSHGGSPYDLNVQLNYLWHELTTSYSSVLHELRNAPDAATAARIWDVGPGGVNSGTGFENSSGSATFERTQYATSFYSNGELGKIPASASAGAGGGGASGGGDQAMTKADYSSVDSLGSLLDSVPALRNLVNKAVANNWTTSKFENAVEDSSWYKNHSDTARSVLIQQANDPASYQRSLQNTEATIQNLSHQLGMNIGPGVLKAIASHALLTGNDSNQQWLTGQISHNEDYSNVKNLNGLTGGMANTAQQLQSLAADYGFNWTAAQTAQHAQNILAGGTTIDTYKQRLMTWAASAFPSFRKQIMDGTTVKDIADPYIQSMSNLLEIEPSQLSTYTPMIRRAMQGSKPVGSKADAEPTATPLWQFEQQVRSDPRWANTDNAHSTMASALLQIGNIFGFGPNSSG